MIKFITKRPNYHQVVEEENVLKIQETISEEEEAELVALSHIGLDLETNSLDPIGGKILLLIVGNETNQFVIDTYSYDCKPLLDKFANDKVYLMANGKFDYKFIRVNYNKKLKKIFDVMIAEQVLVQGTKLKASLADIVYRRLNILMSKDIRDEFIGKEPATFRFSNKHIVYGAGDIDKLFKIRDKQKQQISIREQEFLVYRIEFPLIPIIADMELEGMDINEKAWIEICNKNKAKRYEIECKLDKELRTLRDAIATPEDKKYLTGQIWDRTRQKTVDLIQNNLFGDMFAEIEISTGKENKKKVKAKSPYVNYASPTVLLTILGRLKQPAPTITNDGKKQPGPYVIPTFKTTRLKRGNISIKVNTNGVAGHKFTTGKGSIESYLIENPNTPIKEFIELLIEFRKYNTRINTFGEGFLSKFKHPITGKFYTVYRQNTSKTGRLQSGDKKNNNYNGHNIPREKEYRECFHWENDDITTTDLSGAEGVIMIDKAHDERFYKMAIEQDDAHSPLAMAVWKAIGKYRLDNHITRKNHDKTPYELANIVISKKENKDIRTLFKNTTFASIYRAGYKKIAKMLNISHDEGKIMLQVMRSSIPKTFKMIDSVVEFAIANGYSILNTRTNRRMWYTNILDILQRNEVPNRDIHGSAIHEVTNSSANGHIQGTQADMIKEAMVCIMEEAERLGLVEKYHFAILNQVHDELVTRCNDIIVLVEFKKDDRTIEMVTIPIFVKKWMCQVANRYLDYINMPAEQETLKTWTK